MHRTVHSVPYLVAALMSLFTAESKGKIPLFTRTRDDYPKIITHKPEVRYDILLSSAAQSVIGEPFHAVILEGQSRRCTYAMDTQYT